MAYQLWVWAQRAVGVLALIVMAPFFLLLMAMKVLEDGGPPIFVAHRLGRDAVPFRQYKIRSMMVNADSLLGTDREGDRVTPLGRWMRRWSIDELPQLWNIVKGDMLFIGPRPLHPSHLPNMSDAEMVRFSVEPGLTGLAQVRGRNALMWSERLMYDGVYAQTRSISLDLRILVATVTTVLHGHGFRADQTRDLVDDLANRE